MLAPSSKPLAVNGQRLAGTETAFQNLRMGYGAAIATLLFAILIVFALLQAYFSRRGMKGMAA